MSKHALSSYQKRKLAALKKKAASQSTRAKGVSNAYGQPRPHETSYALKAAVSTIMLVSALIMATTLAVIAYSGPTPTELAIAAVYNIIGASTALWTLWRVNK